MQPQSVTLLPGAVQQFTEPAATAWAISPGFGKIDNQGLYTAPGRLWVSRTVEVSALNQGAVVGRASPASTSVYPVVATLTPAQSLQFLSSVSGAVDSEVIWTASEGEITPSGVFTAPAAPKGDPIMVTATRSTDRTQSATAQVIIRQEQLVMDRSVVDASTIAQGNRIMFRALGQKGPQEGLNWFQARASWMVRLAYTLFGRRLRLAPSLRQSIPQMMAARQLWSYFRYRQQATTAAFFFWSSSWAR